MFFERLRNKSFVFLLPLVAFCLLFSSCGRGKNENREKLEKPSVLVTVAPYKYVVEAIARDLVEVKVVVPTGASSHTFEPTARDLLEMSQASLWFRLGEPFESKLFKALWEANDKLRAVDLREGVDLMIASHCCHGHHHHHDHHHDHEPKEAMDLHIWLSPRQMVRQVETITTALIHTFPHHVDLLMQRRDAFIDQLWEVDALIAESFSKGKKKRHVMVSHPAYSYFCRDYEIEQHSIEQEGKEPTPQAMHQLLELARCYQISCLFLQPTVSNRGAERFAEELGAETVMLDPYSEDYINNLLLIAEAFIRGCSYE